MNESVVKYGTAIIDPPWPYGGSARKEGGRSEVAYGYSDIHYEKLSIEELKALSVGEFVEHFLFLWTTGPFVGKAYEVLKHWGFNHVTMLTWVKTGKDGQVIGAGVGSWTLGNAEYCLIGRHKKSNWIGIRSARGEQAKFQRIPMAFLAQRRKHSQKPYDIHAFVEANKLPGPYLELFAREVRPGWHCKGDEIDGLDLR